MDPRPNKHFYWLILGSWIIAGGALLVAQKAGAQGLDVGIQPFLPQTGLSAPDIRQVAASIIKIFLSLLGTIALVLMLYGGFLWMTAGGNAERVDQAKRLIRNAVIGLIIILSAYAITSFIFLRLQEATGIRRGGDAGFIPGGGVGGGLPPESFVVKGIAPQGKIPIRNVVVRISFSRNVDPRLVQANVRVRKGEDLSDVSGTFQTIGRSVEFTPNAGCPAPNASLRCFDSNTEYVVDISTALKSVDGKDLICGLGGSSCKGVFITGDLVDIDPPQVNMTSPIEGEAVSADAQVTLEAVATDDAGISQVSYEVDGQEVDVDAPTGDTSPTSYFSSASWDTRGLAPGSTHTITAKAKDLDANEARSAAVSVLVRPAHCFNALQDEDETNIDCGGASCGACTGQACTRNADCSAGVCIGGRCLELPQITGVDPLNGAPGNFVTIKGLNFGDNRGIVTFMGSVTNPDDDINASLADCNVAWKPTQVIVQVPEGAVTGPIKLTTSGNLFDQTNDPRGFRGDFLVNSDVRPGLCSINPAEGEDGIEVTLDGKGFGRTKDTVLFGGAKATQIGNWTNENISAVVVPSINPGKVAVAVAVNNVKSNSVEFEIQRSLERPVIEAISPGSGPVGQYVTVKGANFGATAGTVKFLNVVSGVETLADVSFPEVCGNEYWHDDYVIIKVPSADVGSYKVKVVRDNKESNSVDFAINRAPLTPGVCKVDPDNGPVSITINLYGERFGAEQGKVRFFDRQETGRISLWTETNVKVDVPTQTRSGPMLLIDAVGTLSNQILFTVGECSANSCVEGEQCCANGSCQAAGSCSATKALCAYTWLFSTGDLGITDPSLIPNVVDDPQCRDGDPQSPTPYRDTIDACVNAMISARFDKNMREATLNTENISFSRCNTGSNFDAGECGEPLEGVIQILGRDTPEEGFILKPVASLVADTWYQVTIKNGVQSARSINMLEDYVWHFKTSVDGANCLIDFVEVVPAETVITEQDGTQEFTGLPTAANCNILDPDSYVWNWVSSDPARARVEPDNDSNTIATALAETDPGQPVRAAGGIPAQNKGDYGDITIDFANPQVVQHWPACLTACINGKIGARFSQKMNPLSINRNTVKLFSCTDESCENMTAIPLASVTYDPVRFDALVLPSGGLLAPNKFYRGIVLGGAGGVKSNSGTTLVGLNYASVGSVQDSYTWIFKTQNSQDVCAIERIDVAPDKRDIFLIGFNQNYVSEAYAAPDQCDPEGQALNAFFYNWAWLSTVTDVATITNQNVLPAEAVDDSVDPLQVATTFGPGQTKIQAGAQGKAGEGELNVICGFERDGQCPAPATLKTYGVGVDTCCRPRPTPTATNPVSGATDVCRNALIAVSFNQLLDGESLPPNMMLEANFGSSPCPDVAGITSTVERTANADGTFTNINWCRWPGTATVESLGVESLALFEIGRFMEPNREHRVRIRGDLDLKDQEKRGILSFWEVAMNGDFEFRFNVGTEICRVEGVDIIVIPPSRAVARDLFRCAGRDDCQDDQFPAPDGLPGNQHVYMATARDRRGNLMPADYSWRVSGDVVSVTPAGRRAYVTSSTTNGEADVTVTATAKSPTEGSASRSQKVIVFICENPWPNITAFPYEDNATNFSLFYCRDAGEQGLSGDLPPLQPAVAQPSSPDVIKEFLFVIK